LCFVRLTGSAGCLLFFVCAIDRKSHAGGGGDAHRCVERGRIRAGDQRGRSRQRIEGTQRGRGRDGGLEDGADGRGGDHLVDDIHNSSYWSALQKRNQ